MALEEHPAQVEGAWSAEPAAQTHRSRWYHRLGALIYVFFCFEIGVFLLLFPWLEIWPHNWFSGLGPGWHAVWNSSYFRGAVSGLGLVNLGISLAELFRLRRFSR